MGRPQATQISKRLAKTIMNQIPRSVEELATLLDTSPATLIRFRATGLVTLVNLKKLLCYYFFTPENVSLILVGEKLIPDGPPLAVKIFTKSDSLFFDVALEHKTEGSLHLNVVWKENFLKVKDNSYLLKTLHDLGYQHLIVLDEENLPELLSIADLLSAVPEKDTTEDLVKKLSARGYKVTLEIK